MNLKKQEEFIDITGIVLSPGKPEVCKGNGKADPLKCCCDECNFYLECFPEWNKFVYDEK